MNEVRYRNEMVTEMQSKTVTRKVQCREVRRPRADAPRPLKKICDPCYQPCPRTATICKTEKCSETVCDR